MKNKVNALNKYTGLSTVVISPIPYVPQFIAARSKKWSDYSGVKAKEVIDGIEVHYPRYIRPAGGWFRSFEGLSMFIACFPVAMKVRKVHDFKMILGGNLTDDGLASWLLAKFLRTKAASYAIGSDVNTYPYESRLVMILTKFLLRNLDLIICVGKGLKKKVELTLGNYPALEYNYLGVDLKSFRFVSEKANRIPSGLFVGAITKTKGVFDIVEAVKGISQEKLFKITIVGSGTSKDEEKLKELIGDEGRIHFHGKATHTEVANLFNQSDFFVFPTYTEGCACVLTEAAASGLPMLTSNIPQNLDFEGISAIKFEKSNIDQLRSSIINFLNLDDTRKSEMAFASRKLAEENFEEKRAAIHFEKLIESRLRP